jgi:hypothetical protein
MKKSLLIVGLMLAMSLTASAQYKGFAFGFKLGPNWGWTGSTTGAAVSNGARTGFDVGVVAQYYFADNYALVSGINVDFLGGKYMFDKARMVTDSLNPDGYLEIYGVNRIYKSTLYEIPLMLKMETNDLGDLPLRVYAQVGGGIGYAQKVKVKDAIPSEGIEAPAEWGITDREFSNLRFSLKIGAGAQYALDESTRIFAGFYFSHDFVNNINSLSPNYYKYYNGDKDLGERDVKLNMLQNRLGLEVGVLF